MKSLLLPLLPTALAAHAVAAPDEDKLGKAPGYPAGNAKTWFFDEAVRVGSFGARSRCLLARLGATLQPLVGSVAGVTETYRVSRRND
jgi:hypothetical protein